MNIISYVLYLKRKKFILLYLLKKLKSLGKFKKGKMVFPGGKSIPLYYNDKPTRISHLIKDVYPIGPAPRKRPDGGETFGPGTK